MIYTKTAKGAEVLQTRSITLPPRQRTALLLTDGKRSANEVLKQTAGLGSTPGDIEALLTLGLIELSSDDTTQAQSVLTAPMSNWQTTMRATSAPESDILRELGVAAQPLLPTAPSAPEEAPAGLAALAALPEAERYKRAYQIATEITSHMGFKGFRLQLVIEKAGNLIALGELRPRLLDALEKDMGKNEALRKLREFDVLTGQ